MALTINSDRTVRPIPRELERILPYRLCDEIKRYYSENCGRIEEIRLRRGRCASLTVNGKNIPLSCVLCGEEMDSFLVAICDNSLYAHRESIAMGYITLDGGIRVGICGRAAVDGGRIQGVHDISSVNIRIPHIIRRVGEPVCRLLQQLGDARGVLIYSPPGVGKTTLLRSVAARMAGGERPRRVVLIDTREELAFSLSDERLCLDVLSGYPRGLGIEIATRSMNAELLICDEIGDVSEAEAIISAQNCGVPFVASAHADNICGLLRRTGIRRLHEAHVFGAYVGIERSGMGDFRYTVTGREEADAILHGSGSDTCGGMRL